jgi:HipA-like protein
MRQLEVYVNETKAGILTENIPGSDYTFSYDDAYLTSCSSPISVTMPLRKQPYKSGHLFPFFTNLLPEGANRKTICRESRIDENDFFGMLMATVGTDMIGAVNFKNVKE